MKKLLAALLTLALMLSVSALALTNEQLLDIEELTVRGKEIDSLDELLLCPNLRYLTLDDCAIRDASALSQMTGLRRLSMNNCHLSDIAVLSGMTQLTKLSLANNYISDLSPLEGMKALSELDLRNNFIKDIGPLSGAVGLTNLDLRDNAIVDIGPLAKLTNLRDVKLEGNPISDFSPLSDYTGVMSADMPFSTPTPTPTPTPESLGDGGMTGFSESEGELPDTEDETAPQSKTDDQETSEFVAELLDEGEVCANMFWQIYSDGSLFILGQGDMPCFDWYSESSRPPWREYSNQITSIIINEGITSIGDEAFIHCNSLTSIDIPNGVSAIGTKAFCGCSDMVSISIPGTVTFIGDNAFYNCEKLTSVVIPDGVTSIGDAAFDCCSRLATVSIPDSLTNVGNNPFRRCNNLREIDISSDHPSLAIVDGVLFSKSDNCLVCYPCSSTETMYSIPRGTEAIGDCAFWSCDSLHFIAIPDSVNSIGEEAFRGCSNLTSITIPDNISIISDFMFDGCSSLTSFTIPDSVTGIGYAAFSGCSSLASIDIPDSVVSIDHYVFENCSSLVSITIPDSVTSIGANVFDNCSNLASITIPNAVTEIDNCTFRGCTNLASIRIPVSVTSVGWNAFEGCSSLTDIYYEGNEEAWSAISIEHDNDALVNATVHFNTVDHWDFYRASDSEIADAMSNFWSGWDEATGARCTFFYDSEKKRGGYYWQCKQGSRIKGSFEVGELMFGDNDTDIFVVAADGAEDHLSVVSYEDGSIDVDYTSVSDIVSGSVRLYLDETGLKETILDVILRKRNAHNELNSTP